VISVVPFTLGPQECGNQWGLPDSENSVDHFFQVELKWSGFQVVLWKRNYRKVKIANSGDQNRVGLKNSPYKNRTTDPAK
jgi:hypothetical protein